MSSAHMFSAKLKKSKSSILDLFSKPKVERARGARDADIPDGLRRKRSTLSKRAPPPVQPPPTAQSISDNALRHSKSSRSLRSIKRKHDDGDKRIEPPFQPPPLFQAYPQSIRHTILESPELSSLELNSQQESEHDSPTDEDQQQETVTSAGRQTPAQKVLDKFKHIKKPHTQNSAPQHQRSASFTSTWQQKIYILVTSGYLLQYSGDGKYDRLPEAVLKLGPDSAAFASDALEGRHWVLQVVHEAKDGVIGQSPKPLLSKVSLNSSLTRRLVSSMLLVFPSGDLLDSWMLSIRKEIRKDLAPPSKVGLVESFAPEIMEQPPASPPKNHRYSTIIRATEIKIGLPDGLVSPAPSSPTLVNSQRTSFNTLVGSSAFSSSRSSRQPGPLSPVREVLRIETSSEGLGLAGPSSPELFERRPSPVSASDRSTSSTNSFTKGGPRYRPMVPSLPPEYANYKAPPSPHRLSLHSNSSHASSVVADLESSRSAWQKMSQRHSTIGIPDRPAPMRIYPGTIPSSPILSQPTSPTIAEIPIPLSEPLPEIPIVPVGSTVEAEIMNVTSLKPPEPLEEDKITNTATTALVTPISAAESCPTPATESKQRPTSYIRRSSMAVPGEAFALRNQTNRAVKRTSVFARPLPVTITPPHSNPASNRVSVQSVQSRPSPNSSNRVSLQQTPQTILPTSPRVVINRTSSSQSIRTDSARSSASIESSQLMAGVVSSVSRVDNTVLRSRSSSPNSPPGITYPRTSTQVPIIRPPIRPGIRSSRSFHNSTVGLPPSSPPPGLPLPLPFSSSKPSTIISPAVTSPASLISVTAR